MQKSLAIGFLALLTIFMSCGDDDDDIIENGIYGTVTDAATNEAIIDASVVLKYTPEHEETIKEEKTKEPDGGYRFEDLKQHEYVVIVRASGYRSPTPKKTFVTDGLVRLNFELERQELIVTPIKLVFAPDRTTLALTLSKQSNRTVTWEINPDSLEPWLSVKPLEGEIGSISSSVAVKLLREHLPDQSEEQNTDIIIRSNGCDATVTVTVQATENGTTAKRIPQRSGEVLVGDLPFAGPEQIAVDAFLGRAFVTNSNANLISVLDTFTDQVTKQIAINQADDGLKWARGIVANSDRREVYVANYWSGTISLLDAIELVELELIQVGNAPIAMAVASDATQLYLICSPKAGGELVVIDLQSRQKVRSVPIGTELSDIARKGDFFYIADTVKNMVHVVDAQTLSIDEQIPVGAKPIALVASPERDFVYVANALDGTVSIIDTISRRVEKTITVGSQPKGLAVDGNYVDGDVVYVTNSGARSISVLDVAKRKVIGDPITVGTNPIGIAVLSSGNKIYVVNSFSDDVSILEM